jgi:hypothetical protein
LLACAEAELEVLVGLASLPPFCSGLRVGLAGAFELEFSGGEKLVVEPDDLSCEEYWRLFRPGSEEPHFVVGASGIDLPG